ncbi:MAG: YolD-like family protein [Halanaerobiaceae bacterium]|nr:YolD-like family protein [Halanaerobiaceae bacterium]
MLKDRGNIKWTSLMLTEHREKLEELYEHEKYLKKPLLDEQQLERLDYLIKEAGREQHSIKLLYYHNRQIQEVEGRIVLRGNKIFLNGRELIKDNILDIK